MTKKIFNPDTLRTDDCAPVDGGATWSGTIETPAGAPVAFSLCAEWRDDTRKGARWFAEFPEGELDAVGYGLGEEKALCALESIARPHMSALMCEAIEPRAVACAGRVWALPSGYCFGVDTLDCEPGSINIFVWSPYDDEQPEAGATNVESPDAVRDELSGYCPDEVRDAITDFLRDNPQIFEA